LVLELLQRKGKCERTGEEEMKRVVGFDATDRSKGRTGSSQIPLLVDCTLCAHHTGMSLFRPVRPLLRSVVSNPTARFISSSPVRSRVPVLCSSLSTKNKEVANLSVPGTASSAALAGSPLFLTDLDAGFYFAELQFVLSGPINGMVVSMFECEHGPLFLNGIALATLMRMGFYYGWWQPSYLFSFQERYGQSWTVGHHLYGSDLPNPLKKGK